MYIVVNFSEKARRRERGRIQYVSPICLKGIVYVVAHRRFGML